MPHKNDPKLALFYRVLLSVIGLLAFSESRVESVPTKQSNSDGAVEPDSDQAGLLKIY